MDKMTLLKKKTMDIIRWIDLQMKKMKATMIIENNASFKDYFMVLISIPPCPLPCFWYVKTVMQKNIKFCLRAFKNWTPKRSALYLYESHGFISHGL